MMKLDWLIPGYLAGTVRPVTSVEPGGDLCWLRDQGIRFLVSLTDPAPDVSDAPSELEILSFPLEDRGVPAPRATANVCRKMIDAMLSGRPVAVHGSTGFHRTATILACCMVAWRGGAENALQLVREVGVSYVPTEAQQDFVRRFEVDLQTPWSRVRGERPEDDSVESDGPRIRRLDRRSRLRLA